MHRDNLDQPVEDDDLRELLETFLDASNEESLHMLETHGHLLFSETALQQIRNQITELSEIIETLKEKLQLLQKAKELYIPTQKPSAESELLQTLNVNDLIQSLYSEPSNSLFALDDVERAKFMARMPPEQFLRFIQQPPQQLDTLLVVLQRAQNLPSDFTDTLKDSIDRAGKINPHLLRYFLDKIWELPIEKREQLWLKKMRIEDVFDASDVQKFMKRYNIPMPDLNKKQQQDTSSPKIEKAKVPPDEPAPDEHSSMPPFTDNKIPILPLTQESPLQIKDQKTQPDYVIQELQLIADSAGNHPVQPDLLANVATKDPLPKSAHSLYQALFLLQRSEGGRRLQDIIDANALIDDVLCNNMHELDAHTQTVFQQIRTMLQLIMPNRSEMQQQTFEQIIKGSADPLAASVPKDPVSQAFALITHAVAYAERTTNYTQEDIEQAIKDCDVAIELLASSPQEHVKAYLYMIRGIIYTCMPDKQQSIAQALIDFEKALSVFTSANYPNEWAEVHLNRSIAYHNYRAGDPRQNNENALADSLAALPVLSPTEKPLRWAAAHASCGNGYRKRFSRKPLQDIQQALAHYDQALKVFNPQNAPAEWADTRIARASTLRRNMELSSFGNYREVVPSFLNQEYKQLWDGLKGAQKVIEEISEEFTDILTIVTKEGDPYHWADAHQERALTNIIYPQGDRKKHLQAVLEDYRAALEVFTFDKYPAEWAHIQLEIARTFLNYSIDTIEQDTRRALAHIDAALTVYTLETTPFNYYRTQQMRTIMYERLGMWKEAQHVLQEARQVERHLITATQHDSNLYDLLAEFSKSEISLRSAQVALHLDPPDYEAAAIALEEGRSRSLRHMQASTDQQHGLSPIPTVEEIMGCVPHQKAALVYLAAGTNTPLAASANIDRQLAIGPEPGFALILTKEPDGTSHIEHLPLPYLTTMALMFLLEPVFESGINSGKTLNAHRIPVKLEHAIAKLGDIGLSSLAHVLSEQEMQEVTIVPYSTLGLFPLAAAQVSLADGTMHYFGELFEVMFAPSAYVATQARQRIKSSQGQNTVFSAGNPQPQMLANLPYGEEEAKVIQTIAATGGYTTDYLEPKQVTRGQVLRALSRKKDDPIAAIYAHLAIHCIYDASEPLHSKLLLVGKQDIAEQERCIFLGELLDDTLDLSGVRLLVLSACQSSVIDIQQIPNEVVGLAATFLQAGVTGVIASLWKVDDVATYFLMTHFAQLYLDSHGALSPAQALAQAQRWLREEVTYQLVALQLPASESQVGQWSLEDWQEQAQETPTALPFAHPKYWAGFTVTGL